MSDYFFAEQNAKNKQHDFIAEAKKVNKAKQAKSSQAKNRPVDKAEVAQSSNFVATFFNFNRR